MPRLYESSSKPLASRSGRTLSGEFATFDVKNENGRVYPKRIYEAALAEIMPKIREGRLLGECDHPEYDEVRLANVSHVIKECTVNGNKVHGTVELLDTPSGKIIQALVEAGIPIGISSRGVGSTKRILEGTEVTDLKLITYDLVADPSFSGSLLTESAKARLNSRLDSIEKSLPMNEAAGENQLVRSKIHSIRESLEKDPKILEDLVESVGKTTTDNILLKEKLSEQKSRNKSLMANMTKLQESYNATVEKVKRMKSQVNKLEKSYRFNQEALKESYEAEICSLRKELAIEKRGLSKEATMPLLEGLTSVKDIEKKLDSLKHLGNRRHRTVSDYGALTEGLTKPTGGKSDKLSSIISSV